ncbi:MAG: amidase, partial [Frankiaceae bacterium]|nr:amidase [Frankiaceae bacterium]
MDDVARTLGEPREAGPLRGRTFVVKDVFDVAGTVTGAGSPALRARSAPAARSSSAVLALAAAGASYRGRSRSDELAFSLGGVNDADGTPVNPAAPDRAPGGSSSGSAAAVAGGIADIGLGTDTAGSIRVPASYCGLVGVRPTHGRVPVDGLVPLAPSYDTVAWLTSDGRLAEDVGRVLLPQWRDAAPPRSLLLVDDLLPDDPADRELVIA